MGKQKPKKDEFAELTPEQSEPDWSRECGLCGATPVVPITGMCGPCTFGDAKTAGGKWMDDE